jgi:hypothetical protein
MKTQPSSAYTYNVPFHPQIWDLDNWEGLGFESREDALYWQNSSCGVLCLKMAIEGLLTRGIDSVSEMIERGKQIDAYSHKRGWSHSGLVKLAETYGVKAYSSESLTAVKLKKILDEGALVIGSIKWAFESRKSWKEKILFWKKTGGHMALVIGYEDEKGFIVNHTSTSPGYNWEGQLIPFNKFKQGFTGRGVVIRFSRRSDMKKHQQ